MQYAAALLGGLAASAAFWLIDKYMLLLPQSYQRGGMVACFVAFGVAGLWLTSRGPKPSGAMPGTRIASGLKGRNVKVSVDGAEVTGGRNTEVVTDVKAKGDIEAEVKNIKTNP
jgi:hypothetical protein